MTVSPPWSGLARPASTTLGTGPARVTSAEGGRLIDPPVIVTADAVPGALTETSLSPFWEEIARKTPARPPATTGPLGEGPSTNALEIEMPFLVA